MYTFSRSSMFYLMENKYWVIHNALVCNYKRFYMISYSFIYTYIYLLVSVLRSFHSTVNIHLIGLILDIVFWILHNDFMTQQIWNHTDAYHCVCNYSHVFGPITVSWLEIESCKQVVGQKVRACSSSFFLFLTENICGFLFLKLLIHPQFWTFEMKTSVPFICIPTQNTAITFQFLNGFIDKHLKKDTKGRRSPFFVFKEQCVFQFESFSSHRSY